MGWRRAKGVRRFGEKEFQQRERIRARLHVMVCQCCLEVQRESAPVGGDGSFL